MACFIPNSRIVILKKGIIRVPLLKKKRQKAAVDNNNNNNRYETTVPSQFTPQFIDCKANTMADSHIRSTMNYEL